MAGNNSTVETFGRMLQEGRVGTCIGMIADIVRESAFHKTLDQSDMGPGQLERAADLGRIFGMLPRAFSYDPGSINDEWFGDQRDLSGMVNDIGWSLAEVDLLDVAIRRIFTQAVKTRMDVYHESESQAEDYFVVFLQSAFGEKSHSAIADFFHDMLQPLDRIAGRDCIVSRLLDVPLLI